MARTKSTARRTTPINYIGFNKLRQLNLLNEVIERNGIPVTTTTTTTTIEELKNYLILLFGLFLEYNRYQKKNDDITENLNVIELVNEKRIIEKLEEINEISNIKDKEQQLIRLAIQEGSNWLIDSVYFEYLENYNGDIIIPTHSSKPNISFNSSLWLYTQHFFSVDGLKYLIGAKFFENNSRRYTSNSLGIKSKTSKDQFVQFVTLYSGQTDINFGNSLIDGALFHIISGNIIDCTSLESMLELFRVVGDMVPKKDSFNSSISKAFREFINIFDQSKDMYDINSEKIQDLKLSPLPLDKYKWLINNCKANMSPKEYVQVNSLFMCIDSKELVDFILDNKEFYQLVPANILVQSDAFMGTVNIPEYHHVKEISKKFNLGTFEIAHYFQDKLYKIYDSLPSSSYDEQLDEEDEPNSKPTLTVPFKNDRHSIYKSLFLNSILNCNIKEINHFIGLDPPLNFNRDTIRAVIVHRFRHISGFPKIQRDKFTKVEIDQVLQSKFYNDQESRNLFLNHLNDNNFKCFGYSTFDYLKSSITLNPTTPSQEVSTLTSPIIEFKFENQYSNFIFNSYLSMCYLLNSIYNLNFKSFEMLLNLPNFKISLSDIETIVMNENIQFSYDITRGTFQSKFGYQDIKEMLLSLIKVLPPLPESNISIKYIYFHLYKCLLQSIGIEMNDLIEIHIIYNSIGITNEMIFNNNNQMFHLFYWIHLKNKKLSKVLFSANKFGKNIYTLLSMLSYPGETENTETYKQFEINQPQLKFDFIYNCSTNNFKTILAAFTRKKPLKSNEDQMVDVESKNEHDSLESSDEEGSNLWDENTLISKTFSPHIIEIGELDLYLEITNKSKDNCFEDLVLYDSTIFADSDKLEEFISFDKVGRGIPWFIEGAIECERIDIIEKLFSIYPNETIESFNQNENLESFTNFHNTSFLKYMFENHYSIIYKYLESELEKNSKNSIINSVSVAILDNGFNNYKRKYRGLDLFYDGIYKNGYEYSELLLKHIPQLFKFTPSLILSLLEDNHNQLIQYYYEIGTIQKYDFSIEAINVLKSHNDLKYLKWVIDL